MISRVCVKCGQEKLDVNRCPNCSMREYEEFQTGMNKYKDKELSVFLPQKGKYIPAQKAYDEMKKMKVGDEYKQWDERIYIFFANIITTLMVYLRFSFTEIRKRKFGYLLGVGSCLMVVLSILIAGSALAQVPIIFLRLGETANGEIDLTLSGVSLTQSTTFNYTSMKENLAKGTDNNQIYTYNSIRIELANVIIYKSNTCKNGTRNLPLSVDWIYSSDPKCSKEEYCASSYCARPSTSTLLAYDTDLEKKMEYGRKWSYPKLPEGSVYIGRELARQLSATVGDDLYIQISSDITTDPLRRAGVIIENTTTYNFNTYVIVKVADIFTSTLGKYPGTTTNLLMMEYQYFYSLLGKTLNAKESVRNSISKTNAYEYGTKLVFNLPDRINAYNLPDFDNIQRMLVGFSSKISYALGYNQISQSYPILVYMRTTRFFRLFLSLIINIIATILAILCIVLIYSLLIINVENRTFEFGVLRMMGITRFGLIMIILIQAFLYAIPAWIIGIVLGELIYIGVASILGNYFQVQMSLIVTWESFLLASALDIIIPVVASILPIWNALSQNLQDSLDTQRSKVQAVKFKVERSSEGDINWTVVIIGLFFTAFGFGVYYAFPLSLLSFNITLLLYMFFGLLLAMILGMVMLALNVENILEHYVTFLIFFWENNGIRNLITKNLISHRNRNRKTTIMFSLSLGFVIFISIAFNTQIESVVFDELQSSGSRFRLFAPNNLNNLEVQTRLDEVMKKNPVANGVGYVALPLQNVLRFTEVPQIQNIGRYKVGTINIYAVTPNLFSITDNRFLSILRGRDSSLMLSEQPYSLDGSGRLPLGDLYRTEMNIWNFDDSFSVKFSVDVGGASPNVTYLLFKPLAYLSTLPWFTASIYPGTLVQDVFVSYPTYLRLSQGKYKSVRDIPIHRGFISLKPGATESEIDKLKGDIFKAIDGTGIRLSDIEDELEGLRIATTAMDFFLIFTTVIAMIICSFSLTSSMYTNVNEQSKEIGILRAIGCRRFFLWRLYIYEAFILLLCASLIGLVIGIIIGWTMTLQQILFTQYNLTFFFPWQILLVVLGLSFFFAFVSAISPIVQLTCLPIVTILRRLVT